MTRLWGKRKSSYDRDNLIWGAKALVDTLRHYGILINDNAKNVELHYRQERSSDGSDYVRVHVEDLEE